MAHMAREDGVTMLEVTMVLTVTMILIGALTPTVAATLANARSARASSDISKIVTAMQAFRTSTPPGTTAFTKDGSTTAAQQVSLLVSDGDMPTACTAATGCDAGTQSWNRLVDNSAVDFLERHLVTNNPGGSYANDYPVGSAATDWKGAYLNAPIDSDPWGNRYMVNTHWFNSASSNVIVLSAGPNETIECIFTNAGYTLPSCGGDDIAALEQN